MTDRGNEREKRKTKRTRGKNRSPIQRPLADFLPSLLVETGLETAQGLPLNPNTQTGSHVKGNLSNSAIK